MENESGQPIFLEDLILLQSFLKLCKIGMPITTHAVYGVIRKNAYFAARSYKRMDMIDDLIQIALMALLLDQYRGNSPLDGYIKRIIENSVKTSWKKEGSGQVEEFPDGIAEVAAHGLDETIRKLAANGDLRRLLMKRPKLQRKIAIMLILEFGGKEVSQNKVIEYFKPAYKRQEVVNAYSQLKDYLGTYKTR